MLVYAISMVSVGHQGVIIVCWCFALERETPLVQCGCRENEKVTSLFTTKKAARYQKTLENERKETDYRLLLQYTLFSNDNNSTAHKTIKTFSQ